MMIYEICALTHTGLERDNNEDAVVFNSQTQLCILADGMGGYNAGEVASTMAAAFINSEMVRWLLQVGAQANNKEVRRALEICVENANHAIFHAASSNPEYAGMGTTLVVAVFQNDCLVLGHIGDSRCYRLRGLELQQLTKDHSILQEQIDAGLVTPEQALTASNKNLVTRALGVANAVSLEINEHCIEMGDLYVMCSDGLSDMVSAAVIARILKGASTLEQKARQLIVVANEAGGHDNISVLLVQTKQAQSKRNFLSKMLRK